MSEADSEKGMVNCERVVIVTCGGRWRRCMRLREGPEGSEKKEVESHSYVYVM